MTYALARGRRTGRGLRQLYDIWSNKIQKGKVNSPVDVPPADRTTERSECPNRKLGANLPHWKRIAFMAACCERMLPNYETFNRQTGCGDPKVLRRALNAAWAWVETGSLSTNLRELIADADGQAPSKDAFGFTYTSAALDAANGIAETLESISDRSEHRVFAVASLARDTVDLFVQQHEKLCPSDPGFEDRIRASALMQAELRAQEHSFQALDLLHEENRSSARRELSRFFGRSLPAG